MYLADPCVEGLSFLGKIFALWDVWSSSPRDKLQITRCPRRGSLIVALVRALHVAVELGPGYWPFDFFVARSSDLSSSLYVSWYLHPPSSATALA